MQEKDVRDEAVEDGSVLVVEDDPEINELVCAYAEVAGFHPQSAMNGQSALRQAETHPSLILLDVMLPDLDGFEICRRLKSDERTSDIPVVMLTALDRDEYRQRGKQCGAIDYLTKPFDPDELIQKIQTHAQQNGPRGH
jgi:two-component system, OmpR family, response regulator RpaA